MIGNCPICKKAAPSLLLFNYSKWQIRKCPYCGVVRVIPSPTPADIRSEYSGLYINKAICVDRFWEQKITNLFEQKEISDYVLNINSITTEKLNNVIESHL